IRVMAVAEPSTRTRLSSAGLSAAIVALVGYALITGLNVPFPHVVDSTLTVFGVAPPSPRPPTPEKVTGRPKLSPKAEGKADRTSGVEGKRGSVRGDRGGA